MKEQFLLTIKEENLSSIGELRLYPNVEICQHEGSFWIKGDYQKSLKLLLSSIPAEQRLWVTEDERLIPFGKKVPVMKLPIARWRPLKTFMEVELPACAAPGEFDQPIELRLKPSNTMNKANGLLCNIQSLSRFIENASVIRLEPLSYAIKQDDALVLGQPLPPISGSRYYIADKLAIPLGYSFPYLNTSTIKRIIGLKPSEHALFYPNSSWERVPDECIVPLTRSSFRCTREQNVVY